MCGTNREETRLWVEKKKRVNKAEPIVPLALPRSAKKKHQ